MAPSPASVCTAHSGKSEESRGSDGGLRGVERSGAVGVNEVSRSDLAWSGLQDVTWRTGKRNPQIVGS